MSQKLGINEGNLSAYGQGTKKTNGKSTNPGVEFIKKFYMQYPELPESQEGNETNSDTNKEGSDYQHEQPSDRLEQPAQVYQMNWDDPARMRNEIEFLRTEFSKQSSTSLTTAKAFDKMAESTLILSRVVEYYHKPANPGPDR